MSSSASSEQLALRVEEPIYFLPTCHRCGERLGAIPEEDPGNWKAGAAWSIVALAAHAKECPGRS